MEHEKPLSLILSVDSFFAQIMYLCLFFVEREFPPFSLLRSLQFTKHIYIYVFLYKAQYSYFISPCDFLAQQAKEQEYTHYTTDRGNRRGEKGRKEKFSI